MGAGWGRGTLLLPRCSFWSSKVGFLGDFLGGPVIKNLPANAGDADVVPGQRTKIPPATGQPSLHAATSEAHAPQLEKARAMQCRPSAAKIDK